MAESISDASCGSACLPLPGPLGELRLLRLRPVLVSEQEAVLPDYLGSLLRGAFGHALRTVTCVAKGAPCALGTKCAYHYLFATEAAPDSGAPRRFRDLPHPFLIEPPLSGGRSYLPGDELSSDLLLIGRGVEFLPHVSAALEVMSRHGLGVRRHPFLLKEIRTRSPRIRERCLYLGGRGEFVTSALIYRASDVVAAHPLAASRPRAVRLLLETPLRLKQEGRLQNRLDFPFLVRALLRRLSLLVECHEGTPLRLDLPALFAAAEEVRPGRTALCWQEWTRFSSRQQTKLQMGGLVGEAEFRGDLALLLPFLLLGEELHAGKGSVFGLGKYRVVPAAQCG